MASLRMRAALAALTLAASIASPPAARAQSKPDVEAKERFDRGVDLYAQGDYGGALAEFKRAYALAPYPVVLYDLGLTYAALGRPVEAADAMARVLDKPGSLSAERVAKARAVEREQRARVGELVVKTNVDGARIDVDGVEVATTPLAKPIRLKGGPHRVGAVLSGYAPSRKEIDLAAGGRDELRFELVPTDKRLAHLDVRPNVPGATVLVDGAAVGVSPLASTVSVLPGAHDVEAKPAGYRPAKRHVDVGEGSTGEVRLDLEDDPAEVRAAGGDLRLSVSESAPVVLVDGKPEPGLASALRLAPGPHRVRVERAGFFPVERDVDVPARGALDVRVVLEPTADTRAAYVSKNRTMKTLGFVGLLGGAALVGAGAAVALVGNGVKSTASDDLTSLRKNGVKGFDCSADGNPTPIQQTCTQLRDRYDGDFSRGKAMLNGGLVGAGVGVAAIAAGVVLLVAADDPHRYDKKPGEQLAARVRPEFAFSGRGGALGLRVDF